MAQLSVQKVSRDGLDPAFVAAAAGGDTFASGERTFLHAKNGSGGSITVTVDSARQCDQGFDHNIAVAIPAGEERVIGPFPPGRFGPNAAVTYSGVTSLTVAAFEV